MPHPHVIHRVANRGAHSLAVQSGDYVRAQTRPPRPRQLSGSGPGHPNNLPTVSGCARLLLPLATFQAVDRTVHCGQSTAAQDVVVVLTPLPRHDDAPVLC